MPAKKNLDTRNTRDNEDDDSSLTTYAVRRFIDDAQDTKKEKSKGKIQKTFYLPHDLAEMLRKAAYDKRTDQTKIVSDALEMYFKIDSLKK